MPKYSLFIQHKERIKGSRIAKRDLEISLVYYSVLTWNKRNDKRFNSRGFSLFILMGIFLKHLWLIPNILKWKCRKIFTKLVPSQTPSSSSHRWCSVKKVFLKICEISQENICVGVSFIKRRPQHMCFPVKFCKFLRTSVNDCFCPS